jgi:hypothetical protein
MLPNSAIQTRVESIFKRFQDEVLDTCGIGQKERYIKEVKKVPDLHCYNQYLITEQDVQYNFGSYLRTLLAPDYVVHAEMPIYTSSAHKKCDLTVHQALPGTFIDSVKVWTETLVCAIEVKYANYAKPDFDFQAGGGIDKDLKNLGEDLKADKGVLKIIVIIDEANGISPEKIEETMRKAKQQKIILLSNNRGFRI